MKQLPTTYKKNGYLYEQVWRDEDYAIYRQPLSTGCAYEVIKIQKNEAGERFGQWFEASESYPPSNTWGKHGFTVATLHDANDKVDQMRKNAILNAR